MLKVLMSRKLKLFMVVALFLSLVLGGLHYGMKKVNAVTITPEVYYKIINRNSGKALDVASKSTTDGANVQQWSYSGGDNQLFKFESTDSGYYKIIAKHSGKVLDVASKGTADGANVQQWTSNGGTNQQWKLVDLGSGYYRIEARHSGKALEVAAKSTADGGNVQQWSYNSGNNQQWQIVAVSSGTTPIPTTGDIVLSPSSTTTLQNAIDTIQAGKTIYLKAGTYKYSSTIQIKEGNNGTATAMKNICAYGDGTVTIDFSAMAENASLRGIVLAGNYWRVKGITIKGAGDNGMLLAGHHNIIDNCIFRENHDSGLQLSRLNTSYTSISQWPSYNLITDCISTENVDSGRENADGFAAKLTSGVGNKFVNCKAFYNCDDGWDLYTKADTGAIGVVTFENCEASNNGKFTDGSLTGGDGNGFKLGDDTASVAHKLKDCKANNNVKNGYTGNGNPATFVMINCTGTGNGQSLFDRIKSTISGW